MIRQELVCTTWISMQIKASSFLHILNVYSHTKLNTPVLVWSLQLSNFGLTHVTVHFSVTIDCVRFLIRRFPLYTYSMVGIHNPTKKNPDSFADFPLISTLRLQYIAIFKHAKMEVAIMASFRSCNQRKICFLEKWRLNRDFLVGLWITLNFQFSLKSVTLLFNWKWIRFPWPSFK